MFALLPLIISVISFGFWFTYYKCIKSTANYIAKGMSTLVILLFLVHPNIVQSMFDNFQCTDIDSEKRLWKDL